MSTRCERAEALIAEAEASAQAFVHKVFHSDREKDPGSHAAYEVGVLRGVVRDLCTELEQFGSADGIAGAISLLPSRRGDLSTVIEAAQERIQREAQREATYGYDAVSDALDDAMSCLLDCGEYDEEELRERAQSDIALKRAEERRDESPPDDDIRF